MEKSSRGDRRRRRPKRRDIHCLVHPATYLESRSRKLRIFAIEEAHLSAKARRKTNVLKLLSNNGAILVEDEWLEQFWCPDCKCIAWYHVMQQEKIFNISPAQASLLQQVTGVSWPGRNPTVSQYTQRHARGIRL